MTFAKDLEAAALPEKIEAIVIGGFGWAYGRENDAESYNFGDKTPISNDKKNQVLSWEEAKSLLDYDYDTGFGAPECHAVTAWTASNVLWVTEYDGSTAIDSIPRNPTDYEPRMPGG